MFEIIPHHGYSSLYGVFTIFLVLFEFSAVNFIHNIVHYKIPTMHSKCECTDNVPYILSAWFVYLNFGVFTSVTGISGSSTDAVTFRTQLLHFYWTTDSDILIFTGTIWVFNVEINLELVFVLQFKSVSQLVRHLDLRRQVTTHAPSFRSAWQMFSHIFGLLTSF